MDIWGTLERAAELYPDKVAVADGPARATWAEVRDRAARLGLALAEGGVARGDRVAALDVNSSELLEIYYAAAGIGAILCPINHRLSPREIAFVLKDAGARHLLARDAFAPLVRKVVEAGARPERICWIGESPEEPDGTAWQELMDRPGDGFDPVRAGGDDPAHLYYTSGTTGRAKGVVLTHRNVCVHALAAVAELGLDAADVWGHIAPMFHLADAWATFAITWVGGRHAMVPRFDAGAVLDAIELERITLTNLIPTMLGAIVRAQEAAGRDLSSLRLVLSGGAPISPALVRRVVESLGCDYAQTYGMTETSPYLTVSLLKEHLRDLPLEERLAYMSRTGRPFMAVELAVIGEDGAPVARDGRQVGEIRVRGDTVTPGYWNRPEETREAFADGWLRTGDLAVVDREGYVDIVDRAKDAIITGGENVYSIEVESALHEHPEIVEAAVFGVPDETWGEAVRAAVVLAEGAATSAGDLRAFLRDRLASFKVPKEIHVLGELPRTGSGKIHKRALRERYRSGRDPGAGRA